MEGGLTQNFTIRKLRIALSNLNSFSHYLIVG